MPQKFNVKDTVSDNYLWGWWFNYIHSLIITYLCYVFQVYGSLIPVFVAQEMDTFDGIFPLDDHNDEGYGERT